MSEDSPLKKQLVGRTSQLIPLLEEPGVTDILINGTRSLYMERAGRLQSFPTPFQERQSLYDLVERMLIPIGKRVDAAHPYLDGRLSDGSRFHIILPPIAPDGPLISIRKLKKGTTADMLNSWGDPELLKWLQLQVQVKKNMIICGGTGTGKTTLLCHLLNTVPPDHRIAVLEETREIWTDHPHAVFLEARAPSPDGTGEVTLRTLVRNALRMRPDRIVVGECRGSEAFDILQAMTTGHPGSLATLHANNAVDGLRRLEILAGLSDAKLSPLTIKEWVASAIQVVVFLERIQGQRRIAEILQVSGREGEQYRITPKFKYVLPAIAN